MTKARLNQHVKTFIEMGILNPEFKAKSKAHLVESLDIAIGFTDFCVKNSKPEELERFTRMLEDLRWARAQVL